MDSSNNTRAVILAGAISSSTIEPTPFHRRQNAPLRIILEQTFEPLDLQAEVFRYLVPRRCCESGVRRP